jgi:flagellin-specific chaperone FliS
MSSDLETALQLLKLAQRYLDRGEVAKAARAIAQAEEIITEVAKRQAQGKAKS